MLQVRAAGWRVLLLAESDGAARAWLLSHGSPDALASDALITAGPTIPADLLAAVRPRLVVLRPPAERESKPGQDHPSPAGENLPAETTLRQTESGAVSIQFYPDRMEARGFVGGRRIVVKR